MWYRVAQNSHSFEIIRMMFKFRHLRRRLLFQTTSRFYDGTTFLTTRLCAVHLERAQRTTTCRQK